MPLSSNRLCDAEITAPGDALGGREPRHRGRGHHPERRDVHALGGEPGDQRRLEQRPRQPRVPPHDELRSAPRTRAAARPRASTSSGVRSRFATPRTPSVPNFSMHEEDAQTHCERGRDQRLRVLRSLAGLLEAVLLGLLLTGVAREEAGLLEGGAQLGVELDERPGDAEAQGTGLAGGATAEDRGVDVVGLGELGGAQRLGEDHLVGLRREVVGERALVDGDGAVALGLVGADADAGDGLLAATGGLHEGLGHGDLLGGAPGGGDLERRGLLRRVRVVGAGVHLQLGEHLAAEAVLREHAADGTAHGFLGLGGLGVGEGTALLSPPG